MICLILLLPGCNSNQDDDKQSQNQSNQQNNTTQNTNQTNDNYLDIIDKIDGKTTDSMDDLSTLVDDFVTKASSNDKSDLETFFSFKRELHKIKRRLDTYEDEIEDLYRDKTLSKEEYKQLELFLDKLEDKLDDAEDSMEDIFDIDI